MEGYGIQNGNSLIVSIPTEIWCQIFSNISHFPDLWNILLTCRKFRFCLEEHHVLWKQFVLVKQGLLSMASVNYPIGQPSLSSMNDLMISKKGVTEKKMEEILLRQVHQRNRYVFIHFRFIGLKSKNKVIVIGCAAMNEFLF
jgi:hypothetical protein